VSLILEALRKLEREKPDQVRHTTVLLAPIAWPEAARARWLRLALGTGLIAALLAGGWLAFQGRSRPTATSAPGIAAPVPTAAPALPPTPQAGIAPRPAQASSTATKRTGRQAPPPPAAPSATFRLTAIGDQEGVPVAVLNDRLVRVGDSLLGARVVRISEDQVEMVTEADGRHFTLGF